MVFSARSFSECTSVSARRRSSSQSAERATVPSIGRVSTCRPSNFRKRSGELDAMVSLPYRRRAAKGAGFIFRS